MNSIRESQSVYSINSTFVVSACGAFEKVSVAGFIGGGGGISFHTVEKHQPSYRTYQGAATVTNITLLVLNSLVEVNQSERVPWLYCGVVRSVTAR